MNTNLYCCDGKWSVIRIMVTGPGLSVSHTLSLILIVSVQPVLPSACFFVLSPACIPHPLFHPPPSLHSLFIHLQPPLTSSLFLSLLFLCGIFCWGICTATVYRSEKRFGLSQQHHDTTAFTHHTHTHTLCIQVHVVTLRSASLDYEDKCLLWEKKNGLKQLLCC